MPMLRSKRKLAVVKKDDHEEHPGNNQSLDTNVPRLNEDYITQVSEKIEERMTKNLPLEFSGTESRTLGALSKVDDFLLN